MFTYITELRKNAEEKNELIYSIKAWKNDDKEAPTK